MLALFGLFMAIYYDAPLLVWIVGALCLILDSNSNTRSYCHNCD